MKNTPITTVSDHAVLRYLERAGGFEISALRAEIARRVDAAARFGASAVVIDGFTFVIRRGDHGPVVTTVIDRSNLAIRPEDLT